MKCDGSSNEGKINDDEKMKIVKGGQRLWCFDLQGFYE